MQSGLTSSLQLCCTVMQSGVQYSMLSSQCAVKQYGISLLSYQCTVMQSGI